MDLETSVDKAVEADRAEAVDKHHIPDESGIYADLESFLLDLGDIIHSDDEEHNKRLKDAMCRALFYRHHLAIDDGDDFYAFYYSKHITDVGRLMVAAAFANGFRAKDFRENNYD